MQSLALEALTLDPMTITDLPGEQHDLDGWELVVEPDCPACGDPCNPEAFGLCRVCLSKLPKLGGCGMAVRLVAAYSPANTLAVLSHLLICSDCGDLFREPAQLADSTNAHPPVSLAAQGR